MKFVQAVEASQEQDAYRIVERARILVQCANQELHVLIQWWSRRHWKLFDSGGDVRYLNGVRRDLDGFWVINACDCAALDIIAHCLPAAYEHLLTPNSDDWQTRGEKQGERCQG